MFVLNEEIDKCGYDDKARIPGFEGSVIGSTQVGRVVEVVEGRLQADQPLLANWENRYGDLIDDMSSMEKVG